MKTKAKGNRNERKTRKYLEARGYYTTRSAGSFGAFDIIAIPREEGPTKLIQVKSNRRPGKREMRTIERFEVPYYVVKEVWIWEDYVREPIIIDCTDKA